MSALWLNVEVLADREEEVRALFAELAEEDEADSELPPIIQDELPDLTHTSCPECHGAGGFDGDDSDPGSVCALCGGAGEVDVCMGCGCVPTVLNGVDYCHCAAGVASEAFEWEVAA